MLDNTNLNVVYSSTVRMLLKGSFFNGAKLEFTQKFDSNTQFKVIVAIKRKVSSKNCTYLVQFNDIDLADDSNNNEPAEFSVFSEYRLFEIIDSLLDQSLLEGAVKCAILDRDDTKICEFNANWISD